MIRQELGIEQAVTTLIEVVDQGRQRYFAGVAFTRKHALAKKSAPQRHAVSPTNKLFLTPTFNAMGVMKVVKIAISTRSADDWGGFQHRIGSPRKMRCRFGFRSAVAV